MNTFLNIGFALAWLAILAGGWLGWQLLRQNGRLLLRVEGLENQLNEIEFGGAEEPTGLPIGAEAPAFELPDLAGERKSLTQFRGQPLLLIFFHPDCGFCREMMPKLAALPSEGRAPRVLDSHNVKEDKGLVELGPPVDGMDGKSRLVIITSGDVEKNRQLFAEHKVSCPVLLQKDSGVATTYRSHGTPSGYLIDPAGKIASELAMGAEALLALAKGKAESGKQNTEMEQNVSGAAGTAAGNGDGSASRFGGRSLARSKIKRDGLKAGTPAPDFRLPRLDGKGDLSLSELRGKRVVLVFSSPGCGPCNTIAPELEKFHRSHSPLTPSLSPSDGERVVERPGEGKVAVVMISKGEPGENRAKVREHGLTFPIVLQQQWQVSRRYAMFATPIAYLIDEAGIIIHDVAVGVDAILELMARAGRVLEHAQEVTAA